MLKNQKQPLIFIGGFGTKSWMFFNSLEPLKNKFQIFIIDFSHPIKAKNINIKFLANILQQFITNKKIKNPILVGTSFGGAVCLTYCLYHKNYKKIILLNPVGFLPLTSKKIITSLLKGNALILKQGGLKLIISYITNIFFHFFWSIKKYRVIKKIHFSEKQILALSAKGRSASGGKNLNIIFSNKDYLYPKKELEKLPKTLKIKMIKGHHSWSITEPKKLQKIILQTCQN